MPMYTSLLITILNSKNRAIESKDRHLLEVNVLNSTAKEVYLINQMQTYFRWKGFLLVAIDRKNFLFYSSVYLNVDVLFTIIVRM